MSYDLLLGQSSLNEMYFLDSPDINECIPIIIDKILYTSISKKMDSLSIERNLCIELDLNKTYSNFYLRHNGYDSSARYFRENCLTLLYNFNFGCKQIDTCLLVWDGELKGDTLLLLNYVSPFSKSEIELNGVDLPLLIVPKRFNISLLANSIFNKSKILSIKSGWNRTLTISLK